MKDNSNMSDACDFIGTRKQQESKQVEERAKHPIAILSRLNSDNSYV